MLFRLLTVGVQLVGSVCIVLYQLRVGRVRGQHCSILLQQFFNGGIHFSQSLPCFSYFFVLRFFNLSVAWVVRRGEGNGSGISGEMVQHVV